MRRWPKYTTIKIKLPFKLGNGTELALVLDHMSTKGPEISHVEDRHAFSKHQFSI